MAKTLTSFIYILLLLSAIAPQANADIVHLKQGGQIEGEITRQNGTITIEFPNGSITVNAADIEKIEQKPLPQDIFAARLQKADNPTACIELAKWALTKNLDKQYISALRTALLIDHKHIEARRLLREYKLYHARLPCNEYAAKKLLADTGSDFQIFRTEHYRICYNSAFVFAEITGQRLEQLYQEFMAFFGERNFEPAPLTDRLEVVLFDNPGMYRSYVEKLSPEMTYSSGFYSNKTGRSYFYDFISENNNELRNNEKKLQQQQKQINEMRQSVEEKGDANLRYSITSGDRQLENLTPRQMLDEIDYEQKLLDGHFAKLRQFYIQQNVSVTIHEGTHQLAYNCGIHSRYYDNPKWLVEGLAMYFEASQDEQWLRPGLVNHGRLKSFLATGSPGQGTRSLNDLINRDKMFTLNSQAINTGYARGWALFYYLVETYHEQLFDYIYELSLRISEKPYSVEQRQVDFEKHFGDISRLEHELYSFMTNLAN